MGIYSKIFGKDESSKLFDKLDTVLNHIPDNIIQQDIKYNNLASSAVKDVLEYTKENSPKSELEQIFAGIAVPKQRLNRYEIYNEIYKGVPLVKRIFSVYISNVFQKDTITNKIFYIREKSKLKDDQEIEKAKKITNLIIKYYNLEEMFKHFIGHNLLKYGDCFVEVLNLDDVKVKFPTVTPDNKNPNNKKEQIINEYNEELILKSVEDSLKSRNKYKRTELNDNISKLTDFLVEYNDVVDESELITEDESDEFSVNKLKNVVVRYHTPHKIIPLITPYNIILGYVELKTIEKTTDSNTFQRFLDIVEKISSLDNDKNKSVQGQDVLVGKFTDYITKKLLEKYKIYKSPKQNFSDYEQTIKASLKDELYYSLKNMLLSVNGDNLYKNKLNIRFINSERMFWFKMPSSDYYPFGQSIIDPLVITGKLLMFNTLANSIIKLSRASLIRKWTVELGSREDSSALLQKLKRSFKNQRVTASDLATKDITNTLSDFKDIVMFTRRGQSFVDVDVKDMSNPNVKIQDIEDLRNELIALSGIPPTWIKL